MKFSRLKATKSSLYKLICDITGMRLPKQYRTEFAKAPRDTSWWMKWCFDGAHYTAFFSVSLGTPLLAVTSCTLGIDGEPLQEQRCTHKLTTEDLSKRGMVEIVERRGHA